MIVQTPNGLNPVRSLKRMQKILGYDTSTQDFCVCKVRRKRKIISSTVELMLSGGSLLQLPADIQVLSCNSWTFVGDLVSGYSIDRPTFNPISGILPMISILRVRVRVREERQFYHIGCTSPNCFLLEDGAVIRGLVS